MDPQNETRLVLSPSTSTEEEKTRISVLPEPGEPEEAAGSPPERLSRYLKLIDL